MGESIEVQRLERRFEFRSRDLFEGQLGSGSGAQERKEHLLLMLSVFSGLIRGLWMIVHGV